MEKTQGEWIYLYRVFDVDLYQCSICKRPLPIDCHAHIECGYNYCPNCGKRLFVKKGANNEHT